MANIGLDLDGTISDLPAFFSFLCRTLTEGGHKVYIITYRCEIFRDQTIIDLKNLGISYSGLYLCGEAMSAHEWKAKIAVELDLDMMFEDALENLAAMPPKVARVWVGKKLQDLCINKVSENGDKQP